MTTLASDLFNRADESPLASPWAAASGFSGNWGLVSNAAQTTSGGFNVSYYSGVSFPSDQWAEGVIGGLPAGKSAGVAVRANNSSGDAYVFLYDVNDGAVRMYKFVGGSPTQLGTDVSVTGSIGSVLRLDAQGTTIRGIVDGVTKISVTDSAISAGSAGLYAGSTSCVPIDGWSAGDFVSSITGGLAATESGSDTLASTGAVGSNGIRLTLRNTDTGALASSLTGLIVSIRATSQATALLIPAVTNETTDGSGVLEVASGSIGSIGTYVYVTVEKSDNSIVATYRVAVLDLNA